MYLQSNASVEQVRKIGPVRLATGFTGGILSGERGAAKILGINPNTLRSRMEKLGINKQVRLL